ncbi:MAG: hypothetical protein V4478_02400 [Patescibacteria group bacterium]
MISRNWFRFRRSYAKPLIIVLLIVAGWIFVHLGTKGQYWGLREKAKNLFKTEKVSTAINSVTPPFKKVGDAVQKKAKAAVVDANFALIKQLQRENAQLRDDTATLRAQLREKKNEDVAAVVVDTASISPILKEYIGKEIAKSLPAKSVAAKKRVRKNSCNCPVSYSGNKRRVY